jgi:hypothetical protein
MVTSYKAATDIDVLTSSFPIPGFGLIPINAFVLHGSEPVLVDTGAVVDGDEFMTDLQSVIDPVDLKWVWLTSITSGRCNGCSPRIRSSV